MWLSNARDAFKTQLWPTPVISVLAALLLGFGLSHLDTRVDGELPSGMTGWLFGGDADAARSLLGAIASSLITVTSLTFSLTVVTLQLASSQFSPRLLRTFTSDQFVQATLALFLGTFTYSLTVLRAVRSAGDQGDTEFVPKLSVTVAFVLAVVSVVGLVLFLAHLTAQIRVETMLRNVHSDASETMRVVLSQRDSHAEDRPACPQRPLRAAQLVARDNGFLTWFEHRGLLRLADQEKAVLSFDVHPGVFIVAGMPIGAAWSDSGEPLDEEAMDRIRDGVADNLHTGFERTAAQDVGYGLRQLTDVANKALSPGINDPTTAIHALDHISVLLCDLADCDLRSELLLDERDHVRVILTRPTLSEYLDLGISQPRRYGAADPQVLQKIFVVLLDLSRRIAPDQQVVVREQLARLRRTADEQDFDVVERAGLADLGHQIDATLTARSQS